MAGKAKISLAGWGHYPTIEATVSRPDRYHNLSLNDSPSLARGLGRSYGDASLLTDGQVVMMERLDRCLAFDPESGLLRAEAGLALADILEVFIPRGWFLPVTPGTKHVTLGGCVACDVHGKNHHHDGTFSGHVAEIEILTADGVKQRCSATHSSELYWATVGGMGLTGIITEVILQLMPIETAYMAVQHHVANNLDDAIQQLGNPQSDDRYSVAWIDCLARGKNLGRSVVMTGHHATVEELSVKTQSPLEHTRSSGISVPFSLPYFALNSFTVKVFNSLYYRMQGAKKKPFIIDYDRYFYPLDGVGHWNRIYGERGFLQYQFVLPTATTSEGMRAILQKIADSRRASFLAVLKRFGPEGKGYLSFPMEGYTLALDLPNSPGLQDLLKELDDEVIKYGGRVYLGKDASLSPQAFRSMYPRYSQWLEVKDKVDPENMFRSDLSKRLSIAFEGGAK